MEHSEEGRLGLITALGAILGPLTLGILRWLLHKSRIRQHQAKTERETDTGIIRIYADELKDIREDRQEDLNRLREDMKALRDENREFRRLLADCERRHRHYLTRIAVLEAEVVKLGGKIPLLPTDADLEG